VQFASKLGTQDHFSGLKYFLDRSIKPHVSSFNKHTYSWLL